MWHSKKRTFQVHRCHWKTFPATPLFPWKDVWQLEGWLRQGRKLIWSKGNYFFSPWFSRYVRSHKCRNIALSLVVLILGLKSFIQHITISGYLYLNLNNFWLKKKKKAYNIDLDFGKASGDDHSTGKMNKRQFRRQKQKKKFLLTFNLNCRRFNVPVHHLYNVPVCGDWMRGCRVDIHKSQEAYLTQALLYFSR